MSDGLQKTECLLAQTRNRAVLPILAAGLRSKSPEVRAAAIRATIRRRDVEGHTELIRLFDQFGDAERAVLCQAHHAMPHHAAPALKAAVLEGETALCQNACDMIVLCRDFELFAILVKAAEKTRYRHAKQVVATILQLADLLHDELAKWAGGKRAGRDPSFARHQVLAALERSLKNRLEHHPSELVDSFLLLAPIDHAMLLDIMRDPHHPCHAQMAVSLSTGQMPAVMERLVAMIRDIDAPPAALAAIARRADRPFVDFLLHELKHPVPLRVLHNMKRLRSVAWLEAHRQLLLELDGRAQAIAIDLGMASEIDRDRLFDLLKLMLQNGLAEARRASCQALAKFEKPEADELVLGALNDPDGGVQAAALRQLRPRRMPNALQLLVGRLDAPSLEVRDAARSSLAEFNFIRYRAMFDLLDEKAARITGVLVRQVDNSARAKLVEELMSPSVSTRLRGIEIAIAMEAAEDVREQLIDLARHENAAVRKEAVTALAHASGPGVVETLESAARDANRSVADAAKRSLARQQLNSSAIASEHIEAVGHA
jgi:HEAT repeat protein